MFAGSAPNCVPNTYAFAHLWPSLRVEIERHMPAVAGWLVIQFIEEELVELGRRSEVLRVQLHAANSYSKAPTGTSPSTESFRKA
jgi:hypothetical protein